MGREVGRTGRVLAGHGALEAGRVSRDVTKENFYHEALRIAHEVAGKPPLELRLAKEAILKAHEMSLSNGLEYERKLF